MILRQIQDGQRHAQLAHSFLAEEGVDVWRCCAELAEAAADLDAAKEDLLKISRQALGTALDGERTE